MDPLIVLGLTATTTDAEVKDRYHQLVKRYPPDRFPTQFALIHAAYDLIKTQRQRVRTQIFRFDRASSSHHEPIEELIKPPRRRLSVKELNTLLGE